MQRRRGASIGIGRVAHGEERRAHLDTELGEFREPSQSKVPRRGSAIRKRHLRMLKCGVRVGVTVLTSIPELPSAHEASRGGNRRTIRTRSRSHSQRDCYHSTDSAQLTRNRGCGLAVLTLVDQRRQRRVRRSPIRKSGAFRTGTLRASRSTQPLHRSSPIRLLFGR